MFQILFQSIRKEKIHDALNKTQWLKKCLKISTFKYYKNWKFLNNK